MRDFLTTLLDGVDQACGCEPSEGSGHEFNAFTVNAFENDIDGIFQLHCRLDRRPANNDMIGISGYTGEAVKKDVETARRDLGMSDRLMGNIGRYDDKLTCAEL